MFGGFPPATAASSSVGRLEPALRTVTLIPVSFSKGFSAVAKPVASPPENSFHTDTDPPILVDAEALAVFKATTDSDASIAAAVAVTTARFPKNFSTLKFPPIKNRSVTVVVSLRPVSFETVCSPAVHFERITHRSQCAFSNYRLMYAVTFRRGRNVSCAGVATHRWL
jgi:hypothetical protein